MLELNTRWTMGQVCQALESRPAPGQGAALELLAFDQPLSPESAQALMDYAQDSDAYELWGDPFRARRCLAVLFLGGLEQRARTRARLQDLIGASRAEMPSAK